MKPSPKSLANLRPFQPGNPGYRGSQLPKELLEIKSLRQAEVTKLISKYARMTLAEIDQHLEEKKIPILELNFCSIFKNGLKTGDFTKIAFLLDRCIGKIREVVEEDDEREEREELKKLSLTQLLVLAKDIIPTTDGTEAS